MPTQATATCESCDGDGFVYVDGFSRTCGHCGGSGRVPLWQCARPCMAVGCRGSSPKRPAPGCYRNPNAVWIPAGAPA